MQMTDTNPERKSNLDTDVWQKEFRRRDFHFLCGIIQTSGEDLNPAEKLFF